VSKASEWAKAVDLATWLPTIGGASWHTTDCAATVVLWPERRVGLSIRCPHNSTYNYTHLDAAEAIAFARWILDTLGEPEVSP
jgi:hypothetical protein